jgi:hypothetical protein
MRQYPLDLHDAFEQVVQHLKSAIPTFEKWHYFVLILHAFNLSHGFICTFAKGGKDLDFEEQKGEGEIVEAPLDLPVEWLARVNRDHREAEFHYVFADYSKDKDHDFIIKMKA